MKYQELCVSLEIAKDYEIDGNKFKITVDGFWDPIKPF